MRNAKNIQRPYEKVLTLFIQTKDVEGNIDTPKLFCSLTTFFKVNLSMNVVSKSIEYRRIESKS